MSFAAPPSRPATPPRAALWLMAVALLVGVLSGLRWPSPYTLSHLVLDYHFGFGKRGLIGAILERADRPPYHYATLVWLVVGVFAAWVGLLMVAARRGIKGNAAIAWAFILFFLSAGFASLVCDIGRGEHFGLLLAVPCLFMPTTPRFLCARVVCGLAAVLAQEANFLITVPVIALDVWVASAGGKRLAQMSRTVCVALPAAALAAYLGNTLTACNLSVAAPYFQKMAADFSFAVVPLKTLCNDGGTNYRLALATLWNVPGAVRMIPVALFVAMPSTVYNLWLASRLTRPGRLDLAVWVACVCSPLVLLIVAVDVVRFITLPQVTSLCLVVSALRRGIVPPVRVDVRLVYALAILELVMCIPLNDGGVMRGLPAWHP